MPRAQRVRHVHDQRYSAIEKKDFQRRKLPYPTPTAKVATTVRYTSPKGQNSYAKHLVWNFEQLQHGLHAAQASRARQSTTAALRQRERSLMTSGLRVTILKRDDYRCRMCGASAADGAVLHIDHITPREPRRPDRAGESSNALPAVRTEALASGGSRFEQRNRLGTQQSGQSRVDLTSRGQCVITDGGRNRLREGPGCSQSFCPPARIVVLPLFAGRNSRDF